MLADAREVCGKELDAAIFTSVPARRVVPQLVSLGLWDMHVVAVALGLGTNARVDAEEASLREDLHKVDKAHRKLHAKAPAAAITGEAVQVQRRDQSPGLTRRGHATIAEGKVDEAEMAEAGERILERFVDAWLQDSASSARWLPRHPHVFLVRDLPYSGSGTARLFVHSLPRVQRCSHRSDFPSAVPEGGEAATSAG